MLRLKNLEDWKKIDVGKKLILPCEDERKVRLEINATGPVVLTISSSCGKRAKLECVVSGYEVLEFIACHQYEVTGDKPFYCHTVEGEQIYVEHDGSETFTELKVRRPRNLELEEVLARANRNSEVRMRQLMAEHEARLAELQKEQALEKENADENLGKGDSGTDGEGAKPAADGSTSADDKGSASDSVSAEEESEPASG